MFAALGVEFWKLQDIARSADEFGQSVGVEPFADRHRVARHVLFGEFRQRAIDQPVIFAVEIVFADLVGDALPRAFVEHQSAEHGLFGVDGEMRQYAQSVDTRRRSFGGCSHGSLCFSLLYVPKRIPESHTIHVSMAATTANFGQVPRHADAKR